MGICPVLFGIVEVKEGSGNVQEFLLLCENCLTLHKQEKPTDCGTKATDVLAVSLAGKF